MHGPAYLLVQRLFAATAEVLYFVAVFALATFSRKQRISSDSSAVAFKKSEYEVNSVLRAWYSCLNSRWMRFFIFTQSNVFVLLIISYLEWTQYSQRTVSVTDIYAVEPSDFVVIDDVLEVPA